MRHTPALRLRDCQPGQTVHLRGPKGYPFVSIDGHVRLHYGERGDRYGKLWLSKVMGRIAGYSARKEPTQTEAWRKCYGDRGGLAACIQIEINDRPCGD